MTANDGSIFNAPASRILDVAKIKIKDRLLGKLTGIVATHRHKDHISGFDPQSNGKGPGAVIRGLNPDSF